MLEIKIDINRPTPLYQQIFKEIKKLINNDQLKPGEQIPSVRDLAGWLQVNPSTIARAYFDLKQEGLVVTSCRRGTIIIGNQSRLLKEPWTKANPTGIPDDNLIHDSTQYSDLEDIETAFTLRPAHWRVQRVG